MLPLHSASEIRFTSHYSINSADIKQSHQELCDGVGHSRGRFSENKEELTQAVYQKYAIRQFIMAGENTGYNSYLFKARNKKSTEGVALNFVDLKDQKVSSEHKKQLVEKEKALSSRLGVHFAVQTIEEIKLPETGALILVQELADGDLFRLDIQVDDLGLGNLLTQVLTLYSELDRIHFIHCRNLHDLLYFRKQGAIKLSAFEHSIEAENGELNSLDQVKLLIKKVCFTSQADSEFKPWVESDMRKILTDLLNDKFTSAEEALKQLPPRVYEGFKLTLN
ncbi:hypothetical protein JQC92_00145 [Shewanella sp. 202IG2-18]|uniref:hypothetical protein n=1 Tax=Parashewanella hymeniacidonis TaxID=2807618 RepID=UPI0019605BBD|nr:hypothetical protein [Parashewanella hymeniacidonis]MBM7070464.1 hypothetical protein [Parashewanella hymeniacidonis]